MNSPAPGCGPRPSELGAAVDRRRLFLALIFGMTQLGNFYAGWDPDWFKTFLGVMLIGATLVNIYVKRKADVR
jgi:ribose/xylose/arabinose/galactoside ABC-type transport system permease subunit